MKEMKIEFYDELPAQAAKIRTAVFVEEQGFEEEFDDLDLIARHAVLYLDGAPAGTCRYFVREGEWTLGRFALLPQFRGTGAGRALLRAAEGDILSRGGFKVNIFAQCRARSFYEKCGYLPTGRREKNRAVRTFLWKKSCPAAPSNIIRRFAAHLFCVRAKKLATFSAM